MTRQTTIKQKKVILHVDTFEVCKYDLPSKRDTEAAYLSKRGAVGSARTVTGIIYG